MLRWRLIIALVVSLLLIIAVAVFLSVNFEYAKGVVQNVLSDFVTIIILAGLGLVVVFTTERAARLGFFKLGNGKSKRLFVYLSALDVKGDGSVGWHKQTGSFKGIAIPAYESDFIPRFQSLFNFIIPASENLTGFLQRLFVADVNVIFRPAPDKDEGVERTGTIVSLGSPTYNIASQRIEAHFKPFATFYGQQGDVRVQEGETTRLFTNADYAFVQRVRDPQTGQTAFYLAGPSIAATTAAMHYFFDNWRWLAKEYPKGEPFCAIVLARNGAGDQYSEEYRYPRPSRA